VTLSFRAHGLHNRAFAGERKCPGRRVAEWMNGSSSSLVRHPGYLENGSNCSRPTTARSRVLHRVQQGIEGSGLSLGTWLLPRPPKSLREQQRHGSAYAHRRNPDSVVSIVTWASLLSSTKGTDRERARWGSHLGRMRMAPKSLCRLSGLCFTDGEGTGTGIQHSPGSPANCSET
jgi:hypothetical protein